MKINIISDRYSLLLLDSISKSNRIKEFDVLIHSPFFINDSNLEEFNHKLSSLFYGRHLHKGEMGCSLAHSKLISNLDFVSSDWNLILEDDAILEDNLFDFLHTLKDINLSFPVVLQLLPVPLTGHAIPNHQRVRSQRHHQRPSPQLQSL